MSWVLKKRRSTETPTKLTLKTMKSCSSIWATCHKSGMMQTRIAHWKKQKWKVNTRSNSLTLSQPHHHLWRTLSEAPLTSDPSLWQQLCPLISTSLIINSQPQLRKDKDSELQGSVNTWTRWIHLIQAMWILKDWPETIPEQMTPQQRMRLRREAADLIAPTPQPQTTSEALPPRPIQGQTLGPISKSGITCSPSWPMTRSGCDQERSPRQVRPV